MKNKPDIYQLTYGTPVMNGGWLQEYLGFLADTQAADKTLKVTYIIPDSTDDHTTDMLLLISEVTALLRGQKIETTITKENHVKYQKGVSDHRSSSWMGLHFGHWELAADDEDLYELHVALTKIGFQAGASMKQRITGLYAILEKFQEVILM